MHSKKHIRLISDIEKALKKTKFIKEFRVSTAENLKGNQILHAKDWLPTARHLERGEANIQSVKQKSRIDQFDDSLPWAISHGEPISGSDGTAAPVYLSDMLIQAAAQPDKGIMYILDDGSERYISYRELLADAKRILRGLRTLGLKPQDKVIFQFNKNENFVPVFWACVLGGFVSVPVGTALSYKENNADTSKLLNIWTMLNRPAILTDASLVEEVANLKKLWPTDELVIAAAEDLREYDEEQDVHVYGEEDYVLFLFTSGSTGKPKCVRHKNRSIVSRTMATVQRHAFQPEEVLLNWMPLEHVGGLVMYHILGVNLGCLQLLPRIDAFISQPLNWLKWMDAYKVTLTWAPNFAFSLINELEADLNQGQWDLSSVRHILNGGEAIVSKTAKQFLNLLRRYKLRDDCIFPSFGMSETSSGIVYSHSFRSASNEGVHYVDKLSFHNRLRFGEQEEAGMMCFTEVGEPLPGVGIRITDDSGQLVKEQHIGRVQVSGSVIMAGYDQNPEANEEAFTKDGWFNTGDLGFIKNGKLTITGRQKDIIIINGNNYYNYEIEAIVGDVYGVLPTYAAAVPLKDPATGMEELILFFSPTDDKDLNYVSNIITQIRRVVSTSLGVSPKYIIPVKKENFSRTESGKIQRNAFAERFNRGEFEDILRLLEVRREEDITFPEWFYTREWTASSPSPDSSLPSGSCLIFNDRFGLGLAWASQIKGNSNVIMVDEGQMFEKRDSHHYIINPKSVHDYNLLMEHLSVDHLHIDHVFHLWAYQQDRQQTQIGLGILKEAQFKGTYSLLNLIQALNKHDLFPSTMTAIASNVSWFRHGDKPSYENATLPGLVKTLGYEYPQMTSTFIDIDVSSPRTQMVEIISKEWHQLDSSIVMYRQGQRYVPKLRKLKVSQQHTDRLPLIHGGLYLITGGLGGIGALIAQYLIEYYDANVVIIGKTCLDGKLQANEQYADRLRTLGKLQELGSRDNQVIYAQADVSSWSNLNSVLQKAFVSMNTDKINGIIHLAGIYEESLIAEQSIQFLESMYETKVWGTYNMARLLEQYPDAMLVTSSSTSSITSGYGISAYSSANTFSELFTEYLADKYQHVYCLSWSLWSQIGLGKQFNNMQELLRKRGHIPVTPLKGMYSFELSLMLAEPLVYIGLEQASPDIVLLSEEAVETEFLITVEFTTHVPDYSLSELYDSIRKYRENIADDDVIFVLRHLDNLDEGRRLASYETKEAEQGIEQQLVHMLSSIVQQEHVNAHDNFFDMGGNSLKAARLLSSIQSNYGVSISLRQFMESPTISSLASRIRAVENHSMKQDTFTQNDSNSRTKHHNKLLELMPSQLGQWFLHQTNPDSPCYNITFTLRFDGLLEIPTLLKSVEILVKKQDALRMLIKLEDDLPRISLEDNVVVGIPIMDLSVLDPLFQQAKLVDLISAESNKPFSLAQDALSRFTIIKLSDYCHVLLGSMHHIISDGWSVHVLTEEIIRYYTELKQGNVSDPKEQVVSYGDYIENQKTWLGNDIVYLEHLDYWKKALAIDVAPISLPLNFTRPLVQTYNGTILEYETGKKLASKISEACRYTKTSKYMFLLAVFATLLYRYSSQDKLRIGTVMANRNWPYSDEWIGYLANTLALDIDFTGTPTFGELLTQVKNVVLEAHEHQSIPLESILRELKVKPDAGRSPLFQVVFTVQNAQQSIYKMEQGTVRLHIEPSMTSKYDLSLHVYETDEDLRLRMEYNTDLFTEQTIQAFLEHYINLAESAADYCCSILQSN